MVEGGRKPAAARVRGSRARIETVKKTAEHAGLQLAREQDDSVSQVAQTLARLTENESLAQLDGRLTFAERQLDRLSSRREESDRLIDSELAVMRARLEDTLTAFAAATQEHREAAAASERRLRALASEAELHTRAMVEELRVEMEGRVDESTRSAARLEARIGGVKQAFEEEASKRASALDESVAAGRELLATQIAAAAADLEARTAASAARLEAAGGAGTKEAILGEVEGRMYEWMAEPLGQVERLHADLAAAHAAVRAGNDELRGDLLDALTASEEKALGAAVHPESLIVQVRRRLVGDEAEWSAVVGEAGEAVASLRARVEDLLGRVCSIEARHAAERGAWGPQLEGIDRRLDRHEEWTRAAVAEASLQDLRVNALDARIAALAEIRGLAEEQAGAIEYLKHRMQSMGERVGVPVSVAPPDSTGLAALEARLDELAAGQLRLSKRLEQLEERADTPPDLNSGT